METDSLPYQIVNYIASLAEPLYFGLIALIFLTTILRVALRNFSSLNIHINMRDKTMKSALSVSVRVFSLALSMYIGNVDSVKDVSRKIGGEK